MGGGKKYGGVYTMFVPLIFVPFVLLFWASSVLSYIFSPLWLEKCFYISHASLVGFV